MFITYEKNVQVQVIKLFFGSSLEKKISPKMRGGGGPWENGIFGFESGVILGIYAKF